MKFGTLDRMLLMVIAVSLATIALHPVLKPQPVLAAPIASPHLYIEPGVFMLVPPDKSARVLGKVVVDLSNGNTWGFPTTTDAPYPFDSLKTIPPTSSPMYLGKFDFSAMQRSQ